MMSIWLADVNGRVVKAIVEKNLKNFIYRVSTCVPNNKLLDFCPFSVCSTFIDSEFSDRLLAKEVGAGV
jgi:hypothetical protein